MSKDGGPAKSWKQIETCLILAGLAFSAALSRYSYPQTKKDTPRLEVTYSKNIELFGILANLTTLWETTKPNSPFAEDARKKFLAYKTHKAVERTQALLKMRNRNFLVHIAVHLSDFPEARLFYPSLPFYIRILLAGSIADARDFYRDAAFEEFWRDNKSYYEEWRGRLEEKIRGISLPALLESFFGSRKDRYRLIFTPQMARLRMWRAVRLDGEQNALVIFGPWEDAMDGRMFISSQDLIIEVALREFSRLFLSHILDNQAELLKKYAHLEKEAEERWPSADTKGAWKSFLQNNLASAVQVRLAGRVYGRAVENELRERNAEKGYVLTQVLGEIIQDYEQSRYRYPDFASFLPDLLARLEERMKNR